MKYEIFEGSNLQAGVDKCLKAGFVPATLKQVYDWRINKESTNWFDTGTVYFKGYVRKAKLSELKNLADFYDKGGRLLVLGDNDHYSLYGYNSLSSVARFLGVVK